jgi:hypothetical protein
LSTDQKGALAELAIAKAAVALGVGVWHPFGDERCDFIFDIRPELVRVQCKCASLYGDVVIARCYRARRNSSGCVRRVYTRDEVDAFALYCPDNDTCYLLPFDEVTPSGQAHLRIGAARNNQRVGVRWARDFEFAATLRRLGAVAQLGERRHGMAEATGSSPVGSTSKAASVEAALFELS